MATVFDIPDDFRAFMQHVVAYLDLPGEDKLLDGDDALQHEVGRGGRIAGTDQFRFWYVTPDGLYQWELVLREASVRDVADGLRFDLEGVRHELARTRRRVANGAPLMIWGEYGDDALYVADHRELIRALDLLHVAAADAPRMVRLWNAYDDQVVAVFNRALCALYVVESDDGYATSTGDRTRTDAFACADHDGKPLTVPFADCIAWDRARNALLQFVDHGNLGPEIAIEGRIPSLLLMMGDIDRKAAVAVRAEPAHDVARSSLPRLTTAAPEPVVEEEEETAPTEAPEPLRRPEDLMAWARRLIDVLRARDLIELGTTNLDELSYQLGGLLQSHGVEAEDALETAEWLAHELGAVRGVDRVFATGGDLQIALRRARLG